MISKVNKKACWVIMIGKTYCLENNEKLKIDEDIVYYMKKEDAENDLNSSKYANNKNAKIKRAFVTSFYEIQGI